MDIISKLKDKILILIEAYNRQKKITSSREQEIKALEQKIESLNLQLKQQKENYELKITEGAEKNKSSENAKMLIEQLVAEVDACIEMLEK